MSFRCSRPPKASRSWLMPNRCVRPSPQTHSHFNRFLGRSERLMLCARNDFVLQFAA